MATRHTVSEIAERLVEEINSKPKQIIIEAQAPNIIKIDGKKYIADYERFKKIDGIQHSDKLIYKEFDELDYKRNIDVLVDAIADNTTKKELIREIVKKIDFKSLRRLVKRIESGNGLKKQIGCIGFKIGDAYLQLID